MNPTLVGEATGEEIDAVISKIEPHLDGVPRVHVLIACISLALLVQYPDLTPDELQQGVRGVSQYICMFLDGLEMGGITVTDLPKEQIN